MRRVVIESPYAGGMATRARNVLYARACVIDCLSRGDSPYASHLFLLNQGFSTTTYLRNGSSALPLVLSGGRRPK